MSMASTDGCTLTELYREPRLKHGEQVDVPGGEENFEWTLRVNLRDEDGCERAVTKWVALGESDQKALMGP